MIVICSLIWLTMVAFGLYFAQLMWRVWKEYFINLYEREICNK